jgi:transcriptional regulator with XRE-family HTH domain
MKPEQAQELGELLKERREACGLSMRGLARATAIHQATIVRLEAGSIAAPKADKLSRIAQALGISGADFFALAGYAVPADLPSLRPYLQAKYAGLLSEDLDKIDAYVSRLAKKRGVELAEPAAGAASTQDISS